MKYILIIAVATCISCTNLDFGQEVTYRVNGGRMLIEYMAKDNQPLTLVYYTSWSTTWKAGAGDPVYLKAINDGNPGGMSITVYLDGREWITKQSMAEFDTLSIDDKVPFRF